MERCNHDNFSMYDEYDREKLSIATALCKEYNFKYQVINNFIIINSIIDEWYVNFTGQVFKLFHKNKLYATTKYHYQKTFNDIASVINYIYSHDNFYYRPNKHHKLDIINKFDLQVK